MIGTIPENTKPSRVNRKRKRRWKISDLIKSGLTDCYAVAHNLTTAPHWAVEFCSSRTGVQSPLKRVVFLCQKFSTVIQSSEPFYYGVVRHGAVKFSQDLESRYFLTGSFGTAPDSETPTSTSRPGCPPGKNRLLRSQVSAVPSPNRIPTGRSRNSLSSTRLPRAVVPVLAVRMPRITAAAGTVASR